MFRVLVVIFILTFYSTLWAQERCGTKVSTTGQFENWMNHKIQLRNKLRRTRVFQSKVYQVPVVVHVLHNGENIGSGSNLSRDRIVEQIDSLNVDFRRLNADAKNTPTRFLPVAADIEIEFVLAKQDPLGNPSDGIVRIDASESFNPRKTEDLITMRSLSFWSAEDYINIYVGDLTSPLVGLAVYPETDEMVLDGVPVNDDRLYLDAVFIDYEYFGNNTESKFFESRGRTLTHEIGHFFGLRHIWGDGGCGFDDFVDDTPLADDDNDGYGSPCTFPNPDDEEVCDPEQPEMFQNFMDYTDDICMNLFTKGQKVRMRTVLENSPRRASLLNSLGLIEPVRFENDLAINQIVSPGSNECSAQFTPIVEVINWGTDTISSYDVDLIVNNSTILTKNIVNELAPFDRDIISFTNQFIFSTPRTIGFQIKNVDNESDGNSRNNTRSIIIESNSSVALPYIETFEAGTKLIGNIGTGSIWKIQSAPNDVVENQALVFNSFNNKTTFKEEVLLATPSLDLIGNASAELSFSYAHSNKALSINDGLIIKISADCGANFSETIFSSLGPDLSTSPEVIDEFIPSSILDWKDTTIGISVFRNVENIQFQFIGLSGGGNNIFLDNIQIIETNKLENDLNLRSISGSLLTCSDFTEIILSVKNAGVQVINSFSYTINLNGSIDTVFMKGLTLKENETVPIESQTIGPLETSNQVVVEVLSVNNVRDTSSLGNVLETTILLDRKSDEFPFNLDFERANKWSNFTLGNKSLWEETTNNQNSVLRANGYDEPTLSFQSWYISPKLSTGNLDSVGLYFRASYGQREGLNDQLCVLLSKDCGESYLDTVLLANADSLSIAKTNTRWVPNSDEDWKVFQVDMQRYLVGSDENLRLAFVFINGNGNDLYLDDISVRANDIPSFESQFLIYPNPSAGSSISLSFNFTKKHAAIIDVISTSGKVVERISVPNALNQVVTFNSPSQPGLYFVRVSTNSFSQTQKLFINP